MNRTLKRAAVLLTATGLACLPGSALADPKPISFNNATTSIVTGDVFGAGHSNIVGSGDGTNPGVGEAAPNDARRAFIQVSGYFGVHLDEHTGDASFPWEVQANTLSGFSFSSLSTATYSNPGGVYHVTAYPDGRVECRTGSPAARCSISTVPLVGVPLISMS